MALQPMFIRGWKLLSAYELLMDLMKFTMGV